jgi:hypothetical protein
MLERHDRGEQSPQLWCSLWLRRAWRFGGVPWSDRPPWCRSLSLTRGVSTRRNPQSPSCWSGRPAEADPLLGTSLYESIDGSVKDLCWHSRLLELDPRWVRRQYRALRGSGSCGGGSVPRPTNWSLASVQRCTAWQPPVALADSASSAPRSARLRGIPYGRLRGQARGSTVDSVRAMGTGLGKSHVSSRGLA